MNHDQITNGRCIVAIDTSEYCTTEDAATHQWCRAEQGLAAFISGAGETHKMNRKRSGTPRRKLEENSKSNSMSTTLQVDFSRDRTPTSPSASAVRAAFSRYGRVLECTPAGCSGNAVFNVKLAPTRSSRPVPTGLLVFAVDGRDRTALITPTAMPTTPASSVPEPERTRKRSSSLPPAKQLAEVRKQLPTVVHVSIDIEDNSPDSPEREEDRNVVRMRGFASMPDEISRRMLQQRLQSDGGGRTVQRVAFETSKMKPVCHITFDSESNATQFVHHVNAAGGFRLNSDTLLTAELLERKCNNTSNRNREVPLDTRLYLVSGLSAKITDELLVTYFGPVLDHDSDDCLFIIYRWATLDRVLVRFKRPKDGYVTLHCEISGFLVDPSLVLSIRPLKQPTTLQVFCSQFASRNKDALDTFVHFLERNSWSADYELCRDKQFACLLVRFDDTNDAQFLLQRATNLLLPFHYVIYPQNDEVQHAVPRSAILRYVPEDADRVCRLQFPVLLDKDWISFLEFLKTRRSQFERKVRESHNVDVTLCADQLAREAGLVQLELQKAEEDELVCLDEWLAAQQNLALEILNSHFAKFSIAVKMGTWSAVTDKLAKDNLTPELFASKGIELVFRYPNIKICGPKDPCSDLYAQLCRLLQEQMQS